MMKALTIGWLMLALTLFVASARADDAATDTTERARADFVRGVDLAGKGLWGEALGAFEQSAKLRPHALTTYNVATCQRALGEYTRARATYTNALDEDARTGGAELPASYAEEAKTRRADIDALLAHVNITLDSVEATLTIDGRPLVVEGSLLVAGIAAAGAGTSPPTAHFEVLADPGAHVITVTRKGFATIAVNRTFLPASRGALDLVMDRLPATLRVSAPQADAIVKLNGRDIGVVPVDTTRPAGNYTLEVVASGFVPYRTNLVLLPGQEANLRAPLSPQPPAITKRWWFWAGAGVLAAVVVGVGVGVFYATRTTPPPDGGGLGWSAPTH